MMHIVPNDGEITDANSAEEDDGGLVDNLSGNQLNAVAESVLLDGRRINNRCETVSSKGLQTPRWVCDGLLPLSRQRGRLVKAPD